MKAAVCTRYGPPEVVRIEEWPKPIPKNNEILIRIHATTVSSGDARIRSGNVPALYKPVLMLIFGVDKPRKPLGTELSGQVVAVGKNVTSFQEGDDVFAMTGMKLGAHAEYIALPERGALAPKPDNISHEEAAALSFGGTSALHFLRKGRLQRGQKVLIYGASGSVGTSAVQLAKKYFGAQVTAVCSDDNAKLVKSLGADFSIDYSTQDFRTQKTTYDLLFDAVGKISKSSCRKNLSPNGTFVTVESGVASESAQDMRLLGELVQSGQFKPVVDRIYPLEQIVEAHAYVDIGHKKGNVVIRVC